MAETQTTLQDILVAVTQAEADARDTLMGGVNSTDAAWDKIREVTGSLRAVIERQSLDNVNVETDYGATGDGVADDTSAINAAIAAASTTNARTIVFPGKSYRITAPIIANVFGLKMIGGGYSAQAGFAETAGRTKILKDGNFDGIVVSQSSISIEALDILGNTGNGGDGISIESSRCVLRDTSCRRHGGVGIRIGKGSDNDNLWRMYNVLCLGNTSHGIYIHDDGGGAPDVNAGCAFGLDLRSNGGDGLRLENAIDNQFYGFHAASNTGFGINMLSGAKGHNFFFPYLESNTAGEGNLAVGALQNMVWGVRQGVDDGWTIGQTSDDNVVLGRNNSLNDMFMVMGNIAFEQLNIGEHPFATAGTWNFRKNSANRHLEIAFAGSSATPFEVQVLHDNAGVANLNIKDGGLKINDGSLITDVLTATTTHDVPSLADGAVNAKNLTVTGATVGDPCFAGHTAIGTNNFQITAHVEAADSVRVIFRNVSGGVVDLASGTLRVVVFKY